MITHAVKKRLYLLLLFFICHQFELMAQHKPATSKEPSWITLTKTDYANATLNNEAEDGYTDVVFEKQVSLAENTIFIKRSFKILNESGIQNMSQLSFYYDPSFQNLTLHKISIIRDGETINKLELSKIKVVQQETDLDRFIYNGTLQAVLFLEDVRKNDVIEYSYSLKGFNPVFQNKYSDFLDTRYSTPLYNLYYKIVVPNNRTIYIKNYIDTLTPAIHKEGNQTVYEWTQTNIHAFHTQDHLPNWYDAFGTISISEYKDWKEVIQWARTMFLPVKTLAPALQKKIDEIVKNDSTQEQKVQAALRFVQDDVRYMGLEMGVHSHLPATPDKTFARRFGDCKEKSYLLVTMLNKMGIEAFPVLINATSTIAINNWLPSPKCFDHVTVRIALADGYHWFDPTISYQRGLLKNISYPDYKVGLVIQDSTTALTEIKHKFAGTENVREMINITDMKGHATLKVETTYTGFYADDMRERFSNNSNYEMLNNYKKFYQNYFSGIIADSLSFTDDSSGSFTTKEYYKIDSLWKNEKGVLKRSFTCYIIDNALRTTKDKHRTMPFAIDYPANYHEEVEITLPEDWNLNPFSTEIKHAGFTFKVSCITSSRKVLLKYDFESLKDNITPAESDGFFAKMSEVFENENYELSINADGLSTSDLTTIKTKSNPFYVAIPILMLIGAAIWWTQRRT